jgi:hypothetical protein
MRYRAYGLVFVGAALTLVAPLVQGASSPSANGLQASDPLLYAHVVIEGTVRDIANREVRMDELGITDLPGVGTVMKEVKLEGLTVLRGLFDSPSILIDLNAFDDFSPETLLGKRIILCGNWKQGLARYVVASSRSILIKTESGYVRERGSEVITDIALATLLESAKPESITREADLVMIGRVVGSEKAQVDFESGQRTKVWKVNLDLERTLKGKAPGGRVSFVIIRGDYTPPWRGKTLSTFNPGERWLIFLAERDGLLVPVLGNNGVLLIDGENLIYDRAVRYPLSRSRVESVVSEVRN